MPRGIWVPGLVVAVLTALMGLVAESEPLLLVETVAFYALLAMLVAAGVRALLRRRARAQAAGTGPNAPRPAADARQGPAA